MRRASFRSPWRPRVSRRPLRCRCAGTGDEGPRASGRGLLKLVGTGFSLFTRAVSTIVGGQLLQDASTFVQAFDASSGELRTHYAGFFDSGFGYAPGRPAEESAAAVVLAELKTTTVLLEEEAVSASSGKKIHRLVVKKAGLEIRE